MDYNPASVGQLPNESTAVIIFERIVGGVLRRAFVRCTRLRGDLARFFSQFDPAARRSPPFRDRKFADSPLEGDGFEPSVPRQRTLFETAPFELAFPTGRERDRGFESLFRHRRVWLREF